jgi:hypothetical protein
MSNPPLDIDAAKRLADDVSKKLADIQGNGPKVQELRAEVEQLRGILDKADAEHSWIADKLKAVEGTFEHAATELLADGIKIGTWVAEIGRILGVR